MAAERSHDPTLVRVAECLADADRVLVTCHRGPDGDSVGSMVALASLLASRGKAAILYNPDPVPRRLRWLPLVRRFTRKLSKQARFSATVVVDCADPKLLGSSFPGPEVTGRLVVLDHHSSARRFGDIYLCDPAASSVGVLVARMARYLGWTLPGEAALGIYVSLVSDTGSFAYANTTPEALHLAAELVDRGVDPWTVHERLEERSSLGRYRLLSRALDTIELALEGKVAFMTITREMIKEAGATWDDSTDLVNYTRGLDGVECGILLTPAKHGGIRVSMRSKGWAVDAGDLCEQLGGGGHRGAAACMVEGSLEAARKRIEAALAGVLGIDPATASPDPSPESPPDRPPDRAPDRSPKHAPKRSPDHDAAPGEEPREASG